MKKIPLHPLLLALYAPLALLAANIDQLKASDTLRSLVACLGLALLIWGIFFMIVRNARRSALLATVLLFFFFTYGHVYGYLQTHPLLGIDLGRHRFLLPAWGLLLGMAVWWAAGRRRDLSLWTANLNLVLCILLLVPIIQVSAYAVRSGNAEAEGDIPPEYTSLQPAAGYQPDIYLVILDGYGRQDVLASTFGLDNRDFLDRLEAMGFQVAPCSQANYAQTELSLASMMNMAYLDDLGDFPPGSEDRTGLRPLFRSSLVRRILEQQGYRIIAFESSFYRTELTDADVYYSIGTAGVGALNGYEIMLVRTTAGLILTDAAALLPRVLTTDLEALQDQQKRDLIEYVLQVLPETAGQEGPKFVFLHIVAPHEPYVFGAEGQPVAYREPLSDEDEINGYRDQLMYLNSQVIPALEGLIRNSPMPPVIILMGDHGPGWASMRGRMSNLLAAYLPGVQNGLLYPTVTPVNLFRIILNEYYGADSTLREDHSYFSIYQQPFEFSEVPNECRP